jgi:hypothetical protein
MLKFRDLLEEREKSGQTRLFLRLQDMEKKADQRYLSLLGQRHGSHAGILHCKNIEAYLDRAVPDDVKHQFSSTEIFLLLSSIVLHDIGKVSATEKEAHPNESCVTILEKWPELEIHEQDLAPWIGLPPRKCASAG